MFVNPVRHITFDAHDPFALATFWAVVTGYVVDAESEKGDDEVMIFPPEPVLPGILFIRVPDEKSAKNRVHLDIQPATGTRDETVERLLVAGATVYEDHRRPDGTGWVTMRDPEGNEFCVERSAAERA
ncbi:VOC family protein [Amorphoplanes digitatis]|uniref:Putative enzyme related to lactoylglutathione lyase n=1 Tax=Actinoplanes digitatis TaxID=1868 RepID=A0A7W7HZ24_9ACTN|nr:VOC family protein [Actinoplanes digitatis]MBB4763335.1 putative enzyme related to lactoylglutathione lyase [Actinoplanes digitatis]